MGLQDLPATTLLSEFPEASLIMAPDGKIVFANPAAVTLFELEAPPTGDNITRFLPEDERSRLDPLSWMLRWADRPDAPELAHVHLQCRTGKGRSLPIRVRVGRIRDSSGAVFYVVMMSDVSEMLERQYRARAQHRLAARVLAISADAIITTDHALNITYANAAAERLFGYPAATLIGKPLARLLPEQYRAGHEAQIRAFEAESTPARLMGERSEVAGLTASGEVVPLEAAITKVTLDSETVFSAHLRDLRTRKAAAAEQARTAAELHAVFDQALQAMAMISNDGKVMRINQAARQLLPPETNAVGADFESLPFWSADPDATAETLRAAMSRCRDGETVRLPATIVFPNGENRQLDFSLSPVIDAGRTVAMLAEARALLQEDHRNRA
jgi:PAS domain S-box-containing protein